MPSTQTLERDIVLERFNRIYALIFLAMMATLVELPGLPIWSYLSWGVKPLIMLSLGYFFVTYKQFQFTQNDKVFLGAIVASFIGDVILMFNGDLAFALGVGSFMVAQLMYAWVFAQEGSWKVFREVGIVFLIGYGIGFLHYLWPHLNLMKAPITIYAFAILIMGICALSRKQQVSRKSFGWVLLGAMFFILSDSILAIHRFGYPIPLRQFTVMGTYMLAQYLIVFGYTKR